jgi:hypothetical protein
MFKPILLRNIIFPTLLICCALVGVMFSAEPAKAESGIKTLSCTPPAADPEISELARALNYDLNLIYEYVYYNIEHTPTFGLKKSPLATVLDGSGNNMDQNYLFQTLLKQSCMTAYFRYGSTRFPAEMIAGLLGVDNDAAVLTRALGNGAIPHCIKIQEDGECVNSGGPAESVIMRMIWTRVTADGKYYYLDPSFKSYEYHEPIGAAEFSLATGYDKPAFLAAAASGASAIGSMPAGVVSLKNFNRANIVSNLNAYSENLAEHIRTNMPSASMKEIFGGRTITNAYYGASFSDAGDLCTSIASCTSTYNGLRTQFTVKVADADSGITRLSKSYYADEIAGKRLTLNYDTGGRAQLMLDGQLLATGLSATSATQIVTLTAELPYTAGFESRSIQSKVTTGGTYSVILGSGETGRGRLTRQQKLAANAQASGALADSEAMLGGGVAIVANAFLSQISESDRLAANMFDYIRVLHLTLGVVGYDGKVKVDIPAMAYSSSPKNAALENVELSGSIFSGGIRGASLESTVVKQLQEIEAVSTPRMFDFSNNAGVGFIQATPDNWSDVKEKLTNWSASDLADMDEFLTEPDTVGRQIILPQDGSQTVNDWSGNGYYLQQTVVDSDLDIILGAKITGNYKGGYGTAPTSGAPNLDTMILPTGQAAYEAPLSWDPIDLQSGYFLYDHDDISVGSAEFPFGLTLKRSYNSGIRATSTALGQGWRHNLMMTVFQDSDPYEAFGNHNPLAAVTTVTAIRIMKDLITSSAPGLPEMVSASITASC